MRRSAPLHLRMRRRAWWPDGPATEGAASNPTGFAPIIREQPAGLTAKAGNTATFRVDAVGEPLSYQWQVDTGGGFGDVSGATGSSYTTPPTVYPDDDGSDYQCVVSNAFGTATSAAATLTVASGAQPPIIADHPDNTDVPIGLTQDNEASFSVTATGDSLAYQWQVDDGGGWDDVVGATNSTYVRSPVATFDSVGATSTNENGYQFRCAVSNSAGSVTSDAATLTTHRATPAERGAALWIEADTGVFEAPADPAENGDGVDQWADQIGAVVYEDLSSAPTYDTTAINARSGVVNATTARMQYTGTIIGGAGAFTVVACGDRQSAGNGAVISGLGAGGIYMGYVTTGFRLSDSVSQLMTVPNSVGSGGKFVGTCTRNGTSLALRHNGPTNSTSGTITTCTGNLASSIIFNRGAGDLPLVGVLAGFEIHASVLSSDGLKDAENYWAERYGVTLT